MFPNYHEHIRKSICLLPSIRDALKRFRSKCWSSREAECSNSELRQRECLADVDPTRILGAHSECKAAFMATVGTPLHRPCSCKGLNGGHLLTCSKIHSVFHNRSNFGEYSFDLKTGQSVQSTDFNTFFCLFSCTCISAMSWKSPSKLPGFDESETDQTRSNKKYTGR